MRIHARKATSHDSAADMSFASPRAVLNAIIDQYAEIPGGYDSITPFLRQVERVMKKSEHNLEDMF